MTPCSTRLLVCLAAGVAFFTPLTRADDRPAKLESQIKLVRVPEGALQPQALADKSGIHVVYFQGDPKAGDLFYAKLDPAKLTFDKPVRVNSHPNSAIAVGNIRGAHLAVGENGRVHVAWMGSQKAEPKASRGGAPFLYARLNDAGTAFAAQRNLIEKAEGLDGGGSIAADGRFVYVFWHAGEHDKGEAGRRVWMRVSGDGGKTFERGEIAASEESTGVCGCCGMRAWIQNPGTPLVMYRSATDRIHRDTYLAFTPAGAKGIRSIKLHDWRVNLCPMSSFSLTSIHEQTLAAWETAGQVYFARLNIAKEDPYAAQPQAVPGSTGKRKHPAVAYNGRDYIVVWTENMAWNRGGSLAWQVYGADNKPTREQGIANGVPTWSLVTVVPVEDRFVIIY